MKIRPSMKFAVPAALFLLLSGNRPTVFAQSGVRDEIEQLKKQVAAQQQQINELRRMLEAQAKLLAKAAPGTSTEPPAAPALDRAGESAKAPLPLEFGGVAIAPTGFVDFSQVWRSKRVGSGLPTNFASIPFKDRVDGHRRQTLSSAANSRLGMQINTTFSGIRLLGVVETDFLGYQPGNISTTTNSYGLRLRLAFADLQAGKWEILGGQDWSLLTPGRKGISALPTGLVLTQDLDPNLQSGLVWARSPQARVVYRPKESVALAVSFESGSTYVGGSGGAGAITLPSDLAPNYFNQVDLGSGGLGVPTPHSDLIAKIAFDPKIWGHSTHFEAAGLVNRFSFFNPLNSQQFSVVGGGVSLNAAVNITEKLTILVSNFYSNGGGRYIYGEAPALIIRGDGAPSLVRAMSTMDGVEYQVRPKLKLWAYYGGTYIDRNVAIDSSNGTLVGYGYDGSPDNQNRSIQEVTAGFTRFFWQNPKYGALQFSGQYSWLVRRPWFVGSGRPASANLNMLYLGLRYAIPAARPAEK
jgi:hypothetical protein